MIQHIYILTVFCSKAVIFLWIIFVIYILYWSLSCYLVCSLQPCEHLRERAGQSWLSCVWCFLVFLSISCVVSQVRCGTSVNQFLIFTFLLTLNINKYWKPNFLPKRAQIEFSSTFSYAVKTMFFANLSHFIQRMPDFKWLVLVSLYYFFIKCINFMYSSISSSVQSLLPKDTLLRTYLTSLQLMTGTVWRR